MIEVLKVGQLSTNCYLFYDPKNLDAFIIDPGDDAEYIINRITDLGLKPEAILATHGHFDHILAVTELKLAYSIPFYANRNDAPIVNRMGRTAEYFTGIKTDPAPKIEKSLIANKFLEVGDLELKIIHTPGHTPGSVCFYCAKENLLISGDTIFAEGSYGRTDLAGGDAKKLKESILKILALPDDTTIYSGHGEETNVKKEKYFYRFLK